MTAPRTYEEVIQKMGEKMFHSYMGGGSQYEGLAGVDTVSFIYNVSGSQVCDDAEHAYKSCLEAHYQRFDPAWTAS